jgi:hypothetical protein
MDARCHVCRNLSNRLALASIAASTPGGISPSLATARLTPSHLS